VEELQHIHLIHSVVEVIVTLVIVVLRMINARMGYVEVQVTVQRLQHFDPLHEPHLRAVWTWMWLLLTAGVLTFITCIVCFVVFAHLAHLGWTILSNQACIIIMRLLAGFYESRVHAAVKKIKDDQHKASIAYSSETQLICSLKYTVSQKGSILSLFITSIYMYVNQFS